MSKIYIITCGQYSDYHIVGIYDDKELAEERLPLYDAKYRYADIKEYELNPQVDHPKGLLPYSVKMDIEGNAKAERESIACFSGREWEPYGDNKSVSFEMWAKDEAHAIKIANERRVQLIANNQWMTDFNEWRKLYLFPK